MRNLGVVFSTVWLLAEVVSEEESENFPLLKTIFNVIFILFERDRARGSELGWVEVCVCVGGELPFAVSR